MLLQEGFVGKLFLLCSCTQKPSDNLSRVKAAECSSASPQLVEVGDPALFFWKGTWHPSSASPSRPTRRASPATSLCNREGVNFPRPLWRLLGGDGRRFPFGPRCHHSTPCAKLSSHQRGCQQGSSGLWEACALKWFF